MKFVRMRLEEDIERFRQVGVLALHRMSRPGAIQHIIVTKQTFARWSAVRSEEAREGRFSAK